jgi:hypothetical protein
MDLLSCNILEKKDITVIQYVVQGGLEPHMYRTGDLGICLCALLCAE